MARIKQIILSELISALIIAGMLAMVAGVVLWLYFDSAWWLLLTAFAFILFYAG